MATFDEIGEWLEEGSFVLIKDDEEIQEYIKGTSPDQLLIKVDVPNTDLSFRVHSFKNSEVIDIKTARYFNKRDVELFSKLSVTQQDKFYRQIKRIVFPYGLNVIIYPKKYQVHFAKTIFLEGLTKQYFFDSVFSFIHAIELVSMAYENLSTAINPADMT